MKVYISGAVSSDKNFRKKFRKAEEKLILQGYDVVNPVKDEEDGKSWKYYMRKDIVKLMSCDCIYLLDDWATSEGACLERIIAKKVGMEVIYE